MVTAGRIFGYFDIDRVITGQPFDESIAEEVERSGARRAFLLVGGTLSQVLPVPSTNAASELPTPVANCPNAPIGSWYKPTCRSTPARS